jgi:phosphoglycerol transferase MdoB-like AlkP superfamily enzyme
LKRSNYSRDESAKDYNVVFILIETFAAELTGCLGGPNNLTPNFDKYAKQGILFDRFYTNGQRSNRAISATNCSYAGVPGKCIMLRPQGQQNIPSLPSILKERGYSTHFYYGGDVNFDNMKGFLRSKGVDNFLGDKDFDDSKFINKWGALDGDLFDRSLAELDKTSKPFYAMIYTLTNHEPFDIPKVDFPRVTDDNVDSKLLGNYNTMRYTDFVLGKFIEDMKQKEYFDKTIFVILGDHSKSYHHDLEFDYRKSHTPLLIYAPSIIDSTYVNSNLTSQIDLAPTICDLLNLNIENSFMGQSVFAQNKKNWVLINRNRRFGFLMDDFYISGKFGVKTTLHRYNDFSGNDLSQEFPGVKQKLLKHMYGISQTANSLYLQKRISKNEL